MVKSKKDFFVIAHNIRSLLNVGSIFRSADAFGVSKIYLTGYTGTPNNPFHRSKISKTALGAENFVSWKYVKSPAILIKRLRVEYPNISIVGLDNRVGADIIRPKSLDKFRPKFPLVLILGEEVGGINKPLLKLCDQLIEIPMLGKKESLNVSVAFGIAAYKIRE